MAFSIHSLIETVKGVPVTQLSYSSLFAEGMNLISNQCFVFLHGPGIQTKWIQSTSLFIPALKNLDFWLIVIILLFKTIRTPGALSVYLQMAVKF